MSPRVIFVAVIGLFFFVLAVIGIFAIASWVTSPRSPQVVAQAPAPPATSPAGPSEPCGDGTYAFSKADCERARQEVATVTQSTLSTTAPELPDPPQNTPTPPPTNTPRPEPTNTPVPTEAPILDTVGVDQYASCEDMVQQLLGDVDAVSHGARIVTRPTWPWGAYVFDADGNNEYTYPGWGHFDYWEGNVKNGVQQSVTTADQISFACQDTHGPA